MANLPISPLYIKQTLPRDDNQLPGAIDLFGALSVTSQFKVSLHLANGDAGLLGWLRNSGVTSDIQKNSFYDFFCAEAALPGVTFDTAAEFGSHQGVLEKFPTKKVYTDFTITLYVDNEYQNIRLFEEWMNYINPIYTSSGEYGASPIGQGGATLTRDFFRVRYPNKYRKIIFRKFNYNDSYKKMHLSILNKNFLNNKLLCSLQYGKKIQDYLAKML